MVRAVGKCRLAILDLKIICYCNSLAVFFIRLNYNQVQPCDFVGVLFSPIYSS